MRILVINPNTTASMTRKIGSAAATAAFEGTAATAANPQSGPASIEGYFDERLSVPGLLDEIGSNARRQISAEIARALSADRAEAILLGCAGMTDLAARIGQEHGVPVLDGVAAAVKLCEGLMGLGLSTSKASGYAAPRAKRFAGILGSYSKEEAAFEGMR